MGDGVGGTWYWNRYPGARCDVPSLEYSYGFSKELQQEWEWTEIMPAREEIEEYLNHVVDRFDLRRDIQLGTRVTAATFDERRARWLVETDDRRAVLGAVLRDGDGLPVGADDARGSGARLVRGPRPPDQPVAA